MGQSVHVAHGFSWGCRVGSESYHFAHEKGKLFSNSVYGDRGNMLLEGLLLAIANINPCLILTDGVANSDRHWQSSLN